MFVYCFTNILNNKKYIGKYCGSIDQLYSRYNREIKNKNIKRHIVNALRKYGVNKFKFEIIKDNIINEEELNNLEILFISKFNSYKNGYNMTPGGDGGPTFLGRSLTNEHKEKIRIGNLGKKRSKETKLKCKMATVKRLNDPNYILKYNEGISKRNIIGEKNGMFGKHHSLETKIKISQAMKKKYGNG